MLRRSDGEAEQEIPVNIKAVDLRRLLRYVDEHGVAHIPTDADLAAPDDDGSSDSDFVDPCPAGGEHDWREILAATRRQPLCTVCVRCRQELKTEDTR
jgi:hypothetical protein